MALIEEIELAMVCACKERREQADALREEVLRRLGSESDRHLARTVTMENFLTSVVQSLNDDHDAHITSIDTDQWSAVTVEKYDGTLRMRVECDRVEDGLAAAWKALSDGPPYESGTPGQ